MVPYWLTQSLLRRGMSSVRHKSVTKSRHWEDCRTVTVLVQLRHQCHMASDKQVLRNVGPLPNRPHSQQYNLMGAGQSQECTEEFFGSQTSARWSCDRPAGDRGRGSHSTGGDPGCPGSEAFFNTKLSLTRWPNLRFQHLGSWGRRIGSSRPAWTT
jgi:hypothetical protein